MAWTLRDYTSQQDLRDHLVSMPGGVLVPQGGTGSETPQSRDGFAKVAPVEAARPTPV